jgi:hypothetical protein
MDSIIGLQYVTPVVLDDSVPAQRAGFLLLKRINAWLATGRLLMALDGAGEDDQLHQYAKYLVDQAMLALSQIQDGTITLPGAVPVDPEGEFRGTGPLAFWADDTSPVEAYQSVFGNPAAQALTRPRPIFFGSRDLYTW